MYHKDFTYQIDRRGKKSRQTFGFKRVRGQDMRETADELGEILCLAQQSVKGRMGGGGDKTFHVKQRV
jgi:hypothetical protein